MILSSDKGRSGGKKCLFLQKSETGERDFSTFSQNAGRFGRVPEKLGARFFNSDVCG
jgi:hypothetical protein